MENKENLLNKIFKLRDEVEMHNRLYYLENNPIISDEEYDFLVKDLEKLEKDYSERFGKIKGKSVTQKVATSIESSKLKKEKHLVPMLSLANCYSFEEIKEFHERILKNLKENEVEYVAEAKLDGFSISLTYKEGELVKALTRGDGTTGENVTTNIKEIDFLPKKLKKKIDIEIRGEVILPLESFKKINEERLKEGLELFASPRNAAAGTIRQLDSSIVKSRNLKCMLYQVVGYELKSELETLELIKELDLEVIEYYKHCKNLEDIEHFINDFNEIKKNLDYATDGVVIKVNNKSDADKLGFTTKAPRWAIAYKYPALQVTTQIKDVTFQVGRIGTITPVAELEPVSVAGAIVSRATLHNFKEIKSKDIRKGDFVFLERSGEVIPKIIKPIIEKRTGQEILIEEPKFCPSCNSNLIHEGEIILRCPNAQCEAKVKKHIEFFASRDAMNIIGLGEAIIEKLFSLKKIKSIEDIYELKKEDFDEIEGFGEKSINNLLNSIEESKKRAFSRVLFALGIENIGSFTANLIVDHFPSVDKIIEAQLEDFLDINGIGEKIAHSLYEYFRKEENLKRIEFLKEKGLIFEEKSKEGIFSGSNFLFTGELSKYTRNQVKDLIQKNGGNFVNSVSKKLNYLIIGNNPGSKLKKAEKLNSEGSAISIINEDDFEKLLKEK